MIQEALHLKHAEALSTGVVLVFFFRFFLTYFSLNTTQTSPCDIEKHFSITNELDLSCGWDNLHVLAHMSKIVNNFMTVSDG